MIKGNASLLPTFLPRSNASEELSVDEINSIVMVAAFRSIYIEHGSPIFGNALSLSKPLSLAGNLVQQGN